MPTQKEKKRVEAEVKKLVVAATKVKGIEEMFDAMFESILDKHYTVKYEIFEALNGVLEQFEIFDDLMLHLGNGTNQCDFEEVVPIVTNNLHDAMKMEQIEKLMKLPMNKLDQIIEENNL